MEDISPENEKGSTAPQPRILPIHQKKGSHSEILPFNTLQAHFHGRKSFSSVVRKKKGRLSTLGVEEDLESLTKTSGKPSSTNLQGPYYPGRKKN